MKIINMNNVYTYIENLIDLLKIFLLLKFLINQNKIEYKELIIYLLFIFFEFKILFSNFESFI